MSNLIRSLELLKEAASDLQAIDDQNLGGPFIDDAWDEYLTARINAEIAITEFVQEKLGFYVLAQIKNVHVWGVG
jgi:hypothetical protein|nr:MAG TPA: hypothetical protein [Caudoviricetes sp.]